MGKSYSGLMGRAAVGCRGGTGPAGVAEAFLQAWEFSRGLHKELQDFAGRDLGGCCVEGAFRGKAYICAEVCQRLVFSGIHGCTGWGEQVTVITAPDIFSSQHNRELPCAE